MEVLWRFQICFHNLYSSKGIYKVSVCERASRARDQHWFKNSLHESLVDSKNILLPPLRIKSGLIIRSEIERSFFVGPDISEMMSDTNFKVRMIIKEKVTWILFKEIVTQLLGNVKDSIYELILANVLHKSKIWVGWWPLRSTFCTTMLKFLYETWPSRENGCIRDIKEMQKRYQVRCNINTMGHYCCSLHREQLNASYRTKKLYKKFHREAGKEI